MKWLAKWLRRMANWLDPIQPQPATTLYLPPDDIMDRARFVVREVDGLPNTPMKKASIAFKMLLDAFPLKPDWQLRLAIELAVSELKNDHQL